MIPFQQKHFLESYPLSWKKLQSVQLIQQFLPLNCLNLKCLILILNLNLILKRCQHLQFWLLWLAKLRLQSSHFQRLILRYLRWLLQQSQFYLHYLLFEMEAQQMILLKIANSYKQRIVSHFCLVQLVMRLMNLKLLLQPQIDLLVSRISWIIIFDLYNMLRIFYYQRTYWNSFFNFCFQQVLFLKNRQTETKDGMILYNIFDFFIQLKQIRLFAFLVNVQIINLGLINFL